MENKIIGMKKLLSIGFVLLGLVIVALGIYAINNEMFKKNNINNISHITI